MSAFVAQPDDARVAWLRAHVAGLADGLDTGSTLDPDEPGQMRHIGADLWVPTSMAAFNLPVESASGLVIESITVAYALDADDFVVSHLAFGAVDDGHDPAGIDGLALRQVPVERLKRRVIGKWILRDRGPEPEDGGPRWESWRGVGQPRASRRGASRLDLIYTARVYCAARYGEGDAHEAVARAFSISKATAGRWIAKARAEGFMEGIEPDRA